MISCTEVQPCWSSQSLIPSFTFLVTAALLPKELTDYQCVTQDLDCKVSTDTDKATISVTNTGNLVAEYVQYTALFFQGDELVYADNDYVVDSDNEIKAGQTEKAESSCNKKFDSVKVYLNGSAY